jgi:hypothetical protein
MRALGHLVHLVQRDAEPALLASEAAGTRQCAHAEAVHTSSAVDSADDNESVKDPIPQILGDLSQFPGSKRVQCRGGETVRP